MLTIPGVPTVTSSPSSDAPVLVAPLTTLDRTHVAVAGGKGANLGELTRIAGVTVPTGFVVTTEAFRRASAVADAGRVPDVPADVAAAVRLAIEGFAAGTAFAVRSSATTEDAAGRSAAGQHDSFLGVVGGDAVVDAVGRCWASLWSERAVAYRGDVDDAELAMAVVVQELVAADVSGVLFTADPATSNRRVAVVEAVAGLGDALVAGTVTADRFRVRDGVLVESEPAGDRPVLSADQVLELVAIGRRIEGHFGSPQDVEWCLAGGSFHVVQARPITTLFPIPRREDDAPGTRVYVSVGHQQMMTDAMRPLGLSLHQRVALRPMLEAGGRVFVDVTDELASPTGRHVVLNMLGRSDPLVGDAIRTVLERPDLAPPAEDASSPTPAAATAPAGPPPLDADPAIPAGLVARHLDSIASMRRAIAERSGAELFDFIDDDIAELKQLFLDPQSGQVIMGGIAAAWWLNDHVEEWLGERNVADALALAVPDNVSAEMGLALLDVADVVRPHPEVITALERVEGPDFLDDLDGLPGGPEVRDAFLRYLESYGMRGTGEIDITRPRWAERPDLLVPLVLGNVRSHQPGEARRRVEEGREVAARTERQLLERLRRLPDGERKAAEAKANIDRLRTFAGYREFPKYGWMCRYLAYKEALMAEADRLVAAGVLRERDDSFYLTLDELRDAVTTGRVDLDLIDRRRAEHRANEALRPPRVLTSDGETIDGAYRRDDLPAGALAGLAVSAGVVEGRARVLTDLSTTPLERGDVLVTTHTDPSWSPLFVTAAGLVTEVGGLTTHGAVVAREYGLPAVVGVADATRRIRDGQRIRVNGTDGYVELLES